MYHIICLGERMFGNKELQILFHMSQGRGSVSELSESLGLSIPETYRKIRLLRSKGVI
jgi:DNA-binding IclR family transcriptional regulator